MDDLQDGREQLEMCSEQQAKRDRKREHPLPHRHLGDDVIDQVGGCLRHASGATARAETARHGVAASSNRSCFTTTQIINVNDGAVHTRSCRGCSPPDTPCQDPPRAYDPRAVSPRVVLLMTESDNPPSEARPSDTEPLVIERLEEPLRATRAEPAGGSPALAAPLRLREGARHCRGHAPPSGALPRHRTERRGGRPPGRIADEVRFFGGYGLESLAFPDWETLPYDRFSPYQDIVSERLATLYRLPELSRGAS